MRFAVFAYAQQLLRRQRSVAALVLRCYYSANYKHNVSKGNAFSVSRVHLATEWKPLYNNLNSIEIIQRPYEQVEQIANRVRQNGRSFVVAKQWISKSYRTNAGDCLNTLPIGRRLAAQNGQLVRKQYIKLFICLKPPAKRVYTDKTNTRFARLY